MRFLVLLLTMIAAGAIAQQPEVSTRKMSYEQIRQSVYNQLPTAAELKAHIQVLPDSASSLGINLSLVRRLGFQLKPICVKSDNPEERPRLIGFLYVLPTSSSNKDKPHKLGQYYLQQFVPGATAKDKKLSLMSLHDANGQFQIGMLESGLRQTIERYLSDSSTGEPAEVLLITNKNFNGSMFVKGGAFYGTLAFETLKDSKNVETLGFTVFNDRWNENGTVVTGDSTVRFTVAVKS